MKVSLLVAMSVGLLLLAPSNSAAQAAPTASLESCRTELEQTVNYSRPSEYSFAIVHCANAAAALSERFPTPCSNRLGDARYLARYNTIEVIAHPYAASLYGLAYVPTTSPYIRVNNRQFTQPYSAFFFSQIVLDANKPFEVCANGRQVATVPATIPTSIIVPIL